MSFKDELKVLLTGDSKGLTKEMGKAKAEVSGFSSGVKSLGRNLAGAFSVGMAVNYAKNVAAATDAQGELARRIGITKGEVDALELSFTQGGMSIGESEKSLDTFNRKLGEFKSGGAGAAKTFEALGISAEDFAGKDFNEKLLMVKDSLSGLDKESQAFLANSLFGEGGGKKMMEGLGSLEKNNKMIKELNAQLGLTEGELAGIDSLGDTMTEVEKKMELVTAALLSKLAPALEAGVVGFGKLGMAAIEAGKAMGKHAEAIGTRAQENGGGILGWGKALGQTALQSIGFGKSDEEVLASAENKRLLASGTTTETAFKQDTAKFDQEQIKKQEEEAKKQEEIMAAQQAAQQEEMDKAKKEQDDYISKLQGEFGDKAAGLNAEKDKIKGLMDSGALDKAVGEKALADIDSKLAELNPDAGVKDDMKQGKEYEFKPLEPIERKPVGEAGVVGAGGLGEVIAKSALGARQDAQQQIVEGQKRMQMLLEQIAQNTVTRAYV